MIDIRKLLKSFTYAFEGINYALNSDQNLVIHLIIALFVVILAIVLNVSSNELVLLILTILMVISAEMVNTALEKMVDLMTREHRIEAKIAKDVSSGMVLIAAIGAIIIGIIIFVPHLTK